ncbi:MAG: starch-binding protein [Muribaculaceae bacterium]|nr:starch-binding protein [Muribaculaceae bacterium]
MIKKLFIYMTLLLSLSACSVEDIEVPSGLSPDGELTLDIAVPDMETVGTRADENSLSDVVMLVLSGSGVEQVEKFTIGTDNQLSNTNQYRIKATIDQKLRTKSGLKFYFIANTRSSVNINDFKGLTEAQLKSLPSSYLMNNNDQSAATTKMIMSGSRTLNEINAGNTVTLSRNAAKITVNKGSRNDDGNWTALADTYPFEVYGTATSSSLVSGALSGTEYIEDAVTPSSYVFGDKTIAYVHRTNNLGRSNRTRPFIIVKAKYPEDGTDYYYRIEFERFNETTKNFETLPLLSNHHYQVLVQEVKGKGDTTVEAAAKNPTSLIQATVYDYCNEAYNMITDGSRELGVSGRLVHNGNATTGGTPEYIYIKVYSPDRTEYQTPSANVQIQSNASWLSFGTIAVTTDSGTTIPGISTDYKGTIYRVPVHFNNVSLSPGDLSGTITVTWKGLVREIPVEWTREFDASRLCTVQLTIKDATSATKYTTGYAQGNDYWSFIRNKSVCDGLSEEQNNGKVRNEGLHFPVNYGGPSARWTYTYKVAFNNLIDGNPYDWKVSTTGINGLSIDKTSGNNITGTAEFTITHNNTTDNWDNKVGKLKFEISKPGENDWTAYELDLYHTGFFDNPGKFRNSNHRMDMAEQDFFYYYEVFAGPDDTYWLDRNLGATSAEYYVEAEGDIAYAGNPEAAGGYYSVASYNNGGDPVMYTDLCPPGFEVPRVSEWSKLRNSSSFITSQSGSAYTAQYTNAAGQVIYFPRCRFYDCDDNIKTGESRAGYYWSQTAANGLEKDQIGNWLRYLKFSGSIASYDNGEVNGRDRRKGSAMSVRCVNVSTPSQTVKRTFFNVSGATHVFLYSFDSQGNRNAVTNWPGKAIGNYVTMGNADGTGSGNQLFNYSYESSTTAPEDFYVMFTFRDINGIWHTMSKGENGETVHSTDKHPNSLTGWKVIGDEWNGKTTALNGTWDCNYNPLTNSATVTYSDPSTIPPIIEPVPDEITIYYSNPAGWGTVYIYAWDGNVENHSWPGVPMTHDGPNGTWSIKLDRTKYKNIIFNNNAGQQTGNISIDMVDGKVYTQGVGQSARKKR